MRRDMTMVFLRSFAESNPMKSELLQQKIENDVDSESPSDGKPLSLYIMAEFCVMLPPIHEYPAQFRDLVLDVLIDGCMKTELESAKIINWCTSIKPMYPLITKSDGNCLLHAVSMAMWGLEDTHLVLRRLLHQSLLDDMAGTFRKRWLLEYKYLEETFIPDLQLTTQNWEDEWNIILQLASNSNQNPTADCLFYTSLEEIHLFVLANVLKRPIIVLTEPVIRSLAGVSLQENNFAGIYLPLHWHPSSCHKSPLVLAFNMNHFTPLITMQNSYSEDISSSSERAVPLMNADMSSLRMHYLLPEEESQAPLLLKNYLNLCDVIITANVIVAAKISPQTLPEEYDLVKDYFQDCELKYRSFQQTSGGIHSSSNPRRPLSGDTSKQEQVPVMRKKAPHCKNMSAELRAAAEHKGILVGRKCIIEYCRWVGSPITAGMCSKCFAEKTYLTSDVRNVEEVTMVTPALNDLSISNAHSAYQDQFPQAESVSEPLAMVEQLPEAPTVLVPVSRFKGQPIECTEVINTVATPISEGWNSDSKTDLKAAFPQQDYQPVTIASKNFYPQEPMVSHAVSCKQASTATASVVAMSSSNKLDDAKIISALGVPSEHIALPPAMTNAHTQMPSIAVVEQTAHINNHKDVTAEKSSQVSELCRRCNSEITSDLPPNQRSPIQHIHSKECVTRSSGVKPAQNMEPRNFNSTTSTQYNQTNQFPGLSLSELQHLVKPITSTAHYKRADDPMIQQYQQSPSTLAGAVSTPLQTNTRMRTSIGTETARCRTKDCIGLPLENPQRICNYCYQQMKTGKTPLPNILASRKDDFKGVSGHFVKPSPAIAPSSQNFDVSPVDPATSTPHVYESFLSHGLVEESFNNRRECANPVCQNMASVNQELCEPCIQILTKHTQNRGDIEPAFIQKGHRCITNGCKYYGAPEFGGYCSQCFSKKTIMEARESHAKAKHARQELARSHAVTAVEPEQTSGALHTGSAPRGRLCALAGCSRFGDPLFSHLCSRCYNEKQELELLESRHLQATIGHQQEALPSATERIDPTRKQMNSHFPQNIPIYEALTTSHPGVEKHVFEQAMTKVEKRHKRMLCKMEGCANFGNSHSYGYCNNCYATLRGVDVID